MRMPGEVALQLGKAHLVAVVAVDDAGVPVIGEAAKLLRQVDHSRRVHAPSPSVFFARGLRGARGFVSVAAAVSGLLRLRGFLAGRASVGPGAFGSGLAVVRGAASPCPGLVVPVAAPGATFSAAFLSVFSPAPVCCGFSVVLTSTTGGIIAFSSPGSG